MVVLLMPTVLYTSTVMFWIGTGCALRPVSPEAFYAALGCAAIVGAIALRPTRFYVRT
jgi:hypothetical protein